MLDKIDSEILKTAEKSAILELSERGIDYRDIIDEDFYELVKNRVEKIKVNVKQVGLAAAITAALTIATGGI